MKYFGIFAHGTRGPLTPPETSELGPEFLTSHHTEPARLFNRLELHSAALRVISIVLLSLLLVEVHIKSFSEIAHFVRTSHPGF